MNRTLVACKSTSPELSYVIQYISTSSLGEYYKPLHIDNIHMYFIELKTNTHENIASFSSCLERAFSYIDTFEMEVDESYMFPNGTIGIKLKMADRCIYNIFIKLRKEATNMIDIINKQLAFHVTIARCAKNITIPSAQMKKDLQTMNALVIEKLPYITFKKPSIYTSDGFNLIPCV